MPQATRDVLTSSALPSFGDADLSNCEREQIHLAGSIQPHGVLLLLDDETGAGIVQASVNAAAFLSLDGDPVGRALADLPGTVAARIGAHLAEPLQRRAVAVRGTIGTPPVAVDALVHRPIGGGIIVELERAGPAVRLRDEVEAATQAILGAGSIQALADETARLVERLTGYDRVMVYRFDELGHGQVFSEVRKDGLEAFLGNRYPASDIPQIARRLYLQNRIRLLVDVDYAPQGLTPRLNPLTGRELDMSLCGLRSMSPIHLQYLRNMGVKATMVVSLVVGGELWGLIACHHYTPYFVPFETRALCEIVGELVSTRVAALDSVVQTQSELIVRRLETRMVEAIARDGDWRTAVFADPRAILDTMAAQGAGLIQDGHVRTIGDVPASAAIREIVAWLDTRPREPFVATADLGRDAPALAHLVPDAAGVLAVPVAAEPGEYLLWFRPERVKTVVWGGDPTKPAIVGTDPRQLSPRLSFAQWHQVVEGTSDPWTRADRNTALLVGKTIADVAGHFRSVRMLIAHDQLATITEEMRRSRRPVMVADGGGRVILTNEAFAGLLQPWQHLPQRLEDLPRLFAEPVLMTRQFEDLLRAGKPCRGEATFVEGGGAALAFRAEPVFASLDRVLGFIVQFDAIGDRKAAEAARLRFQDAMIDRRLPRGDHLGGDGDRDYQAALSGVVENAQLAALEITYGLDADGMGRMLEGVRASVARTANLLEHLIWHGSGVDAEG